MNKMRKQSDSTYPLFFFMVDSSDHVTGKTGLSPTVTISKNGASFASPSGAVSEVGNGLYKIAGNTTDSNTVGELWIHATGTGADPSDTSYTVVAYDPFDAVRLGLTALPNAVAAASGGLPILGTNASAISFTAGVTISNASGSALTLTSSGGNGSGLDANGNGTGSGIIAIGGYTGNGATLVAAENNGLGTGIGLKIDGKNSYGVSVASSGSGAGPGMNISGTGSAVGLSITSGKSGGSGSEYYSESGLSIAGSPGISVLGAGYVNKTGIFVTGSGTYPAASFTGGATGNGMTITGGATSGKGIDANGTGGLADIEGNVTGNLSGSVGSVTGAVGSVTAGVTLASPIRPIKNTGYNNFMFPMFDETTKAPKTGLTVTAQRAIDGNPFAACSNSVAEIGSGVYRINLSTSDLNGDKIMFRFTATGADDQLIEVFTQG